ncbi:hypothetical protein Rvan_1250 [Rhodomicrobium vannielii ATCC 17100]|uniref:Uncharacterized protein n=1 Tax=Rhodomicrobium vannielii (strain ATCC 17100 / DSM 162 / LMG 4299 / NCIMB 10020 / ATH 3.1.1) TaxID=648757 RepID=E3I564_RHOVT|nr:hypothetical protein [Rhodomicrobium vannielii]ADP70514.1 hypothetical protein Rvan_1250 [Rhodomicrobium vannielii ATCC 17100]
MASQFSRRAFIMRFAGLVARRLNLSGKTTAVVLGEIYADLIDILSGNDLRKGAQGGESTSYFEHLTGHALVASRCSPEEAAQIYFDRVLDRSLFLARNNPHHKGHELLAALWRRSPAAGWTDCALIRSLDEPAIPFRKPDGFAFLCASLVGSSRDISKGNPAASTRANLGPLFLQASGARVELPEELSLWGAIRLSPDRLVPLEGEAGMTFRNLVIQAFEAANAPYAALLSVGLWPADWEDTLSTHQAKQLSAFLSEVRQRDKDLLAVWQNVWKSGRHVSGYDSAEDLWRSELGQALRPTALHTVSNLDIEALEDAQGDDEEGCSSAEFRKRLRLCREANVIDELEEWLYLQLEAGANAADLAKDAAIKARLRAKKTTLGVWLQAIGERVCAFVRQLDESIPIEG